MAKKKTAAHHKRGGAGGGGPRKPEHMMQENASHNPSEEREENVHAATHDIPATEPNTALKEMEETAGATPQQPSSKASPEKTKFLEEQKEDAIDRSKSPEIKDATRDSDVESEHPATPIKAGKVKAPASKKKTSESPPSDMLQSFQVSSSKYVSDRVCKGIMSI